MNIAIIDYGMGNLHSVRKALAHAVPHARITLATSAAHIQTADRILLPGQGAIRGCMDSIRTQNIAEALKQAAREKPFLGICIGPQLMSRHSEENGGIDGLGLFPIDTKRFAAQPNIKIPHMGWNTIRQTRAHPLWKNIPDHSHFYYVHSYHLTPSPYTIGETDYESPFPAAIARDNIAGLQAHPEKSAAVGLQILANFSAWNP